MRGITFDNLPPIRPTDPVRMDVACFIGFAPIARKPLFSGTLKRWLIDYGWTEEAIAVLADHPEEIRNTPVPLESWDAFQAVFDETRLDRAGCVTGKSLSDPVKIKANDRRFHVIVDRVSSVIELPSGSISLTDLAGEINAQLGNTGASADLDPETGTRLVIRRDNTVRSGELTVYENRSLGFGRSFQSDSRSVTAYSAAAVKAFFSQGGTKCYFICMGDPLPVEATEDERCRQLYTLIWGKGNADEFFGDSRSFRRDVFLRMFFPAFPSGSSPVADWNGLSHLSGLSDVTYVCFPDLVDVPAVMADEVPDPGVTAGTEVFVPCAESLQDDRLDFTTMERAPVFDVTTYRVWRRIIGHAIDFLSTHAPTIQLVAGLPLPDKTVERDFPRFILDEILGESEETGMAHRHLQPVFPWLKTARSKALPESLEPPDGTFLGILARGARQKGAFRSIAGSLANDAYDLRPTVDDPYPPTDGSAPGLSERVSFFDFVPAGIALQTDVTAVKTGNYRYGAVRRIMILIWKSAQRIGLDHVFEPNGEGIWRTVKNRLTDVLHRIYLRNGLRGRSAGEAYSVSCGRSTMTQNDIDNGRLVASISLQPAVPIERIAVDLLLERNGNVQFGNSEP
jgi:hypothetical protein